MRSLFGLRTAMIFFPSFQLWGIPECWSEKLFIFVSADMPCGPTCFKCKLVVMSGPVACECLKIFVVCVE